MLHDGRWRTRSPFLFPLEKKKTALKIEFFFCARYFHLKEKTVIQFIVRLKLHYEVVNLCHMYDQNVLCTSCPECMAWHEFHSFRLKFMPDYILDRRKMLVCGVTRIPINFCKHKTTFTATKNLFFFCRQFVARRMSIVDCGNAKKCEKQSQPLNRLDFW